MNKAERAALTALLDSVGLGYTKHQAETKLLRAYLQRTQQTVTYKAMILVYESDVEFAGVPWRTENADIVFTKGAVLKWMPIPGDE